MTWHSSHQIITPTNLTTSSESRVNRLQVRRLKMNVQRMAAVTSPSRGLSSHSLPHPLPSGHPHKPNLFKMTPDLTEGIFRWLEAEGPAGRSLNMAEQIWLKYLPKLLALWRLAIFWKTRTVGNFLYHQRLAHCAHRHFLSPHHMAVSSPSLILTCTVLRLAQIPRGTAAPRPSLTPSSWMSNVLHCKQKAGWAACGWIMQIWLGRQIRTTRELHCMQAWREIYYFPNR